MFRQLRHARTFTHSILSNHTAPNAGFLLGTPKTPKQCRGKNSKLTRNVMPSMKILEEYSLLGVALSLPRRKKSPEKIDITAPKDKT